MKFNWGHGLVLFFTVFIGTLIFVLIKSFDNDNSLVANDYYAKDLAYQQQYEKEQNFLQKNHATIEHNLENKVIYIKINTEETVSGEVIFYNPADKTKDFTRKINKPQFQISTTELSNGKWDISVDWKESNTAYFVKKTFYL